MIDGPLKDLFDAGLSDFRLEQVRWVEGGNDLQLTLHPPGSSAGAISLDCVWATAVSVLMEFGPYSGSPLVFEASVTPLAHDRLAVAFLFAGTPKGHLSCECNDVRLAVQLPDRNGSPVSSESPN